MLSRLVDFISSASIPSCGIELVNVSDLMWDGDISRLQGAHGMHYRSIGRNRKHHENVKHNVSMEVAWPKFMMYLDI